MGEGKRVLGPAVWSSKGGAGSRPPCGMRNCLHFQLTGKETEARFHYSEAGGLGSEPRSAGTSLHPQDGGRVRDGSWHSLAGSPTRLPSLVARTL